MNRARHALHSARLHGLSVLLVHVQRAAIRAGRRLERLERQARR